MPDSSCAPQCSSLKTTNGVETKRKVRLEGRGGVDRQGEAALPSQVNRPDCSSKGISWFFGSQGRQRCVEPQGVDNKVVEEGVKSALPKELQPDESYVGSPPLPVLPYVIPGPGGFVQKALETGKPGRSRQVLPELKEDLRPFEQGKVGTEESRFTDEPWRSAIDVLNRRAGERATIRDIKAYGFRGPVSKVILCALAARVLVVSLLPTVYDAASAWLIRVSSHHNNFLLGLVMLMQFVAMIVALNLDGYGGAFVTVEVRFSQKIPSLPVCYFILERYVLKVCSCRIPLVSSMELSINRCLRRKNTPSILNLEPSLSFRT